MLHHGLSLAAAGFFSAAFAVGSAKFADSTRKPASPTEDHPRYSEVHHYHHHDYEGAGSSQREGLTGSHSETRPAMESLHREERELHEAREHVARLEKAIESERAREGEDRRDPERQTRSMSGRTFATQQPAGTGSTTTKKPAGQDHREVSHHEEMLRHELHKMHALEERLAHDLERLKGQDAQSGCHKHSVSSTPNPSTPSNGKAQTSTSGGSSGGSSTAPVKGTTGGSLSTAHSGPPSTTHTATSMTGGSSSTKATKSSSGHTGSHSHSS